MIIKEDENHYPFRALIFNEFPSTVLSAFKLLGLNTLDIA